MIVGSEISAFLIYAPPFEPMHRASESGLTTTRHRHDGEDDLRSVEPFQRLVARRRHPAAPGHRHAEEWRHLRLQIVTCERESDADLFVSLLNKMRSVDES